MLSGEVTIDVNNEMIRQRLDATLKQINTGSSLQACTRWIIAIWYGLCEVKKPYFSLAIASQEGKH